MYLIRFWMNSLGSWTWKETETMSTKASSFLCFVGCLVAWSDPPVGGKRLAHVGIPVAVASPKGLSVLARPGGVDGSPDNVLPHGLRRVGQALHHQLEVVGGGEAVFAFGGFGQLFF